MKRAKTGRLILALLCALTLGVVTCACAASTKGPESPSDDGVRILCYGDSNTWGYVPGSVNEQYPEEQRWTAILDKELGEGYQVIPMGLNGRTTAFDRRGSKERNGLTYLPDTLKAQQPVDILIFMLGTNDCTSDMGLSSEEIAEGMEKLVVKAQKCGRRYQKQEPQIIIVAPAAILPDYQGTLFEFQLDDAAVQKSHELAPLYKQIAQDHGCLFLDATDAIEVSPVDCEHLTVNGHAQLAGLLAEMIRFI